MAIIEFTSVIDGTTMSWDDSGPADVGTLRHHGSGMETLQLGDGSMKVGDIITDGRTRFWRLTKMVRRLTSTRSYDGTTGGYTSYFVKDYSPNMYGKIISRFGKPVKRATETRLSSYFTVVNNEYLDQWIEKLQHNISILRNLKEETEDAHTPLPQPY